MWPQDRLFGPKPRSQSLERKFRSYSDDEDHPMKETPGGPERRRSASPVDRGRAKNRITPGGRDESPPFRRSASPRTRIQNALPRSSIARRHLDARKSRSSLLRSLFEDPNGPKDKRRTPSPARDLLKGVSPRVELKRSGSRSPSPDYSFVVEDRKKNILRSDSKDYSFLVEDHRKNDRRNDDDANDDDRRNINRNSPRGSISPRRRQSPRNSRSPLRNRETKGRDSDGSRSPLRNRETKGRDSGSRSPKGRKSGSRSPLRNRDTRGRNSGSRSPRGKANSRSPRGNRDDSPVSVLSEAVRLRTRGGNKSDGDDSTRVPRRRQRRLSMAEGRAYRMALERAEREAQNINERSKEEDRRKRYRENRNKIRALDRTGSSAGFGGEEVNPEDLRIGDVVFVRRGVGVVKYVGRPHFAIDDELWVGIDLKEAKGNNNGFHRGRRYFDCKDGHGMFVQQVQRRLAPEELLDKLNGSRLRLKKCKARESDVRKLNNQIDTLRAQVAAFKHIEDYKDRHSQSIAAAVEDRMENFLEVLADTLDPDTNKSSSFSSGSGSGIELPPRNYSESQVMGWLYKKKRSMGLRSHEHPRLTDPSVAKALNWCIRMFQDQQGGRMDYEENGRYYDE